MRTELARPMVSKLVTAIVNENKKRGGVSYTFAFTSALTALPATLQALSATYTRNSLKHVIQSGAMVALSNNQFGTSYDYVNNTYGYSAEAAATNLCRHSSWADGDPPTDWGAGTATATWSYGTSTLLSSVNALTVTATAQRYYIARNVSASTNTTHVLSLYVESVTGDQTANNVLSCVAPAGSTVSYPVCEANPSGGETGRVTTGRLVMRVAVSSTAGSISFRCGLGATSSATGSVRVSMPQAEVGEWPTSFIITPTGGTASRAADVLTVPLTGVSGLAATGYAAVVDFRAKAATGADERRLLSIDDGSANNRATMSIAAAGDLVNAVDSGGVAQASVTETAAGITRKKFGASFAADAFLRAVAGSGGTADSAGSMPVSPTTLRIGVAQSGASQPNVFIYSVKLHCSALSQATLNTESL